MSDIQKWPCEYCTYENFPASKKCVLCHAPKPQTLIQEPVDQEIYNLAPRISRQEATPSNGNKWTCPACTYNNWPKSKKCVQCHTVRNINPSHPLHIDVNISEASASKSKNSPRTSPNSPEATKELHNDRNRLMSAARRSTATKMGTNLNNTSLSRICTAPKWTCKACTYENWPRSVKCALCGLPKTARLTESASGGACSQEESVTIYKKSPQISPNIRNMDNVAGTSDNKDDRRFKQIRNKMQESDWLWLNACAGVVEGDTLPVEAYLSSGGDPARQLTQNECTLLNRPSAYEMGYTLVHLALRFQREDMLAVLLVSSDFSATTGRKRVPSHVSPDIASDILRDITSSLRQRKGDFPCFFLTECATFALPTDISDLPRHIQKQLFDELSDQAVQQELEVEESVINWSLELTDHLGSRLYALWNRTAGDCLLDSALQACWGVFDGDNTLRRALADSLIEGSTTFYPRWKDFENLQAQSMHFSLEETQWAQDWEILLNLASQPGASLEQTHIFAVAHILRRPIIVYGVKYVKSFRGETIGYARFQGVYLPLLWEQSFCWKTPIALGYTRGHFSALVPMETNLDSNLGAGANMDSNNDQHVAYLPLTDSEGKLLTIHFLTVSELGREESILRDWLDCSITDGGHMVAVMKFGQRPTKVRQMTDEWLDRYRRLPRAVHSAAPFSSDGETDDE